MALYGTKDMYNGLLSAFLKGSTQQKINNSQVNYPVQDIDGSAKALVRYYKMSGERQAEDLAEYYPAFIIQDFVPTVDKENVFTEEYLEGYFDPYLGMTEKVYLPIPMNFDYQVSAVCDKFGDKLAMYDWMMRNFDFTANKSFEFNRVDTPYGFNADIVRYTIDATEVPREDGRFELVFDFKLWSYIHFKAKKLTFEDDISGNRVVTTVDNFDDAVESIKVSLYNKDFITFEKVLTKEFTIN